jgi:glutathione S-transferase
MPLILHVFPPSPRAFKVLLVANYLRIDYQTQLVNLPLRQQRSPEFKQLNVNQRMPVLEHEGYVLWESNAIAEYLARSVDSELMPADFKSALQIRKWLYWESAHWDQACAILMFERMVKPLFGLGETSETEIVRGTAMMERLAKVLDHELERRAFIAGDTISLADLCIAASFCHAERAGYPLTAYVALQRWLGSMRALPAWGQTTAMQG